MADETDYPKEVLELSRCLRDDIGGNACFGVVSACGNGSISAYYGRHVKTEQAEGRITDLLELGAGMICVILQTIENEATIVGIEPDDVVRSLNKAIQSRQEDQTLVFFERNHERKNDDDDSRAKNRTQ